nr:WhiB family transcriptional regulator [Pseudonocardia sp. EC080625-04]
MIELFFPVGTAGPALQQIAEAKAICRRCPVLQACRAEALAWPGAFTHGVVGGLSEDERHALLRRRAARGAGIR